MSYARFALGLLLATVGMQGMGCATTVRSPLATMRAAPAPKPEQPVDGVQLRAKLSAHRTEQIARLQAYMEAGVFPQNPSTNPAPIHMFRDANGTRCAVANLIHLDGLDALVDAMVQTHNDVVVADAPSGPLADWVLTSGLTNEEVRRIQGPGFTGGESALNAPQPTQIETRDEQIQAYLRRVVGELSANTEASTELAATRLIESPLARSL